MRLSEREIKDRKEIDSIISSCDICHLALSKDNMPYLVPIAFAYDGNSIFFHSARKGQKIEYIKENPNVCFGFENNIKVIPNKENPCSWGFAFQSVIGFGTVTELIDVKQKADALNKIMLHYSGKEWTFDEKRLLGVCVWRIEIESITGKHAEE